MIKICPNDYHNIVVLTGAGISKASGIPTFRGAGGLWNQPNAEKLLQVEELYRNPDEVWHYLSKLKKIMLDAKPNKAHEALAHFEEKAKGYCLITQNIDGLHQRAGSKKVIELHGSMMRSRCIDSECKSVAFEDVSVHESAPFCQSCGSKLRPDIVFFNEMLGSNGYLAESAVEKCDLFIAIGTSGVVVPAAYYVRYAKQVGARTILINMDNAENTKFDEVVLGKAEELLPQILG